MNRVGVLAARALALALFCFPLAPIAPGAESPGTLTVEGNQTVTGNQTVNGTQTVAGGASVANTRLQGLGETAAGRWIRVASLAPGAMITGRVLAQGGAGDPLAGQYVADFAFSGPGGAGPYAPLLVEMGGAAGSEQFEWLVRLEDAKHALYFHQGAGSKYANFLFGCSPEPGCVAAFSEGTPAEGDVVWQSGAAGAARQGIRAGSMALTSGGLTLADGTVVAGASALGHASALVDGDGQTVASVVGGKLVLLGAADLAGGSVTLPDSVNLGTRGTTLSADKWGMLDSAIRCEGRATGLSATASAISGLRVDAAGNRFLFGRFRGTMTLGAGASALSSSPSGGAEAGYILKFDPSGRLLWGRCLAGAVEGTGIASHIADAEPDGARGVYVAGSISGTVTLVDQTLETQGGGDAVVARIDGTGTVAWARVYGDGSSAGERALDLAPAPDGRVILGGCLAKTVDYTFYVPGGEMWVEGYYEGGEWVEGYWEQTWVEGYYEGGDWVEGYWGEGAWVDGYWTYEIWVDGYYDEYGNWVDGHWEATAPYWVEGHYEDGEWVEGHYENQTWVEGHYEDTIWHDGYWSPGTWVEGHYESYPEEYVTESFTDEDGWVAMFGPAGEIWSRTLTGHPEGCACYQPDTGEAAMAVDRVCHDPSGAAVASWTHASQCSGCAPVARLIKLSATDGTPLSWGVDLPACAYQDLRIGVDAAGDVFAAMLCEGWAHGGAPPATSSGRDTLVFKWAAADGAQLWAWRPGCGVDEMLGGFEVSADGAVALAGSYQENATSLPGAPVLGDARSVGYVALLNGATGEAAWARYFIAGPGTAQSGSASILGLARGGGGEFRVVGRHIGTLDLDAAGLFHGAGIFIARVSADGATIADARGLPASNWVGPEVAFALGSAGQSLLGLDSDPSATAGVEVKPWLTGVAQGCAALLEIDPDKVQLSLNGSISAGEGIRFADGTVLTSADGLGGGSGLWQTAGGDVYISSGNVGIGTASPGGALDVAGDARISGPLTLGGDINASGTVSGANAAFANINVGTLAPVGASLIIDGALTATGQVSGGAATFQELTVTGNLTVGGELNVTGTLRAGSIQVQPSGDIPMHQPPGQ